MAALLGPQGYRQATINDSPDSKDHVYGYSAFSVSLPPLSPSFSISDTYGAVHQRPTRRPRGDVPPHRARAREPDVQAVGVRAERGKGGRAGDGRGDERYVAGPGRGGAAYAEREGYPCGGLVWEPAGAV